MIEHIGRNGHKIIEVSNDEAIELQWGNRCDRCNKGVIGTRYYIPVLNYGVCTECSDAWQNYASYQLEDVPYEDYQIELLKLSNLPYFKKVTILEGFGWTVDS